MLDLNDNQIKFCEWYLLNSNATEAYRMAYETDSNSSNIEALIVAPTFLTTKHFLLDLNSLYIIFWVTNILFKG